MKILSFIFSLMLISILVFLASYFLFYKLNLESRVFVAQKANLTMLNNISSYSAGDLQFYPNMRFNHNEITFAIDDLCDLEKKENIALAIARIEEESDGILTFTKLPFSLASNPDIIISCSESDETPGSDYFIAGEGGAENIVNTSMFYIIEKGKVLLFYKDKKTCTKYNIELHELLHVFGFKHSNNAYSMMYNTTQCSQILTNDIVDELKRVYSIPSKADLYFSGLSASEHGRYLDFKANIKNQGMQDAADVKLMLFADGKEIKAFDLKQVGFGEGKTLEIENLRLPIIQSTNEITFILASSSEELDSSNNQATLTVAE